MVKEHYLDGKIVSNNRPNPHLLFFSRAGVIHNSSMVVVAVG